MIGLVVKSTEKVLKPAPKPALSNESDDEDDEAEDRDEPVKMLDTVSTIQDLVVWDHDQLPAPDDAFLKGLNELIAFTDAIHS